MCQLCRAQKAAGAALICSHRPGPAPGSQKQHSSSASCNANSTRKRRFVPPERQRAGAGITHGHLNARYAHFNIGGGMFPNSTFCREVTAAAKGRRRQALLGQTHSLLPQRHVCHTGKDQGSAGSRAPAPGGRGKLLVCSDSRGHL